MVREILASYSGALLFVSHDRAFLRRLATDIWDLTGASQHVPGDYDVYQEQASRIGC